MPLFTSHQPYTFCWADLSTTDIIAAKAFYTQVFGWESIDIPVGGDAFYTMFQLQGKNVCGGSALRPDQQGIPPHWMSHLSVADVTETTNKVAELGGKILAAPFPVMEAGLMSIVQDPQGAILSLWEAKSSIGAEVKFDPNTLCWHELQTPDPEGSKAFFSSLCGWETKLSKAATGEDYFEFQLEGQSLAGMIEIRPEWGFVPPNWGVYFGVINCDQTLEMIQSLGGNILMPKTPIDMGHIAICKDPQGAVFSLFQFGSAEG